jgi:hypothetical protein
VPEGIERRRNLVAAFRDDAPVEVDQPSGCAHERAYLVEAAPRTGRKLRARRAAVRGRDAVVRGLRVAVPVDGGGAPRVGERLVELPGEDAARPSGTTQVRLDRVAEPVVCNHWLARRIVSTSTSRPPNASWTSGALFHHAPMCS